MATQHEQAAQRAAIRPVKESVEDELIARPGVVAVDIAEKEKDGKKTGELSIVVFVEQKKPTSKLAKGAAIPKEIDGIKTDVQELVIELQPAYRQLDDGELFVDPADYPTLAGGIGIGPRRSVFLSPPDVPAPGNYVFVGTLGAMVRDRATGATMGLTNFHVACVNNTWSVGDRQVQPSLVDGGAPTGEFGSLTRAALSENIDGAVITVDASEPWTATVTGVGDVAGSTAATVGMAVQKRGRTTEHTFGTVASTDFTVTINYGSDVGSQHAAPPDPHRHRHVAQPALLGPRGLGLGRSRHLAQRRRSALRRSNDGSMTFANPMQAVLDELGVDLLSPRRSCRSPGRSSRASRRGSRSASGRAYDLSCPTIKTRIPALCPTVVRGRRSATSSPDPARATSPGSPCATFSSRGRGATSRPARAVGSSSVRRSTSGSAAAVAASVAASPATAPRLPRSRPRPTRPTGVATSPPSRRSRPWTQKAPAGPAPLVVPEPWPHPPACIGAAVRHGLVPARDVRAGLVRVRAVSRSNAVHVIEHAGAPVGYVKQAGAAARLDGDDTVAVEVGAAGRHRAPSNSHRPRSFRGDRGRCG